MNDIPLSMTPNAVKRVSFLMKSEAEDSSMLRVTVSGGGCAGFQYSFSFSDEKTDDDVLIKQDGITIVTDNISLLYLAGSQIDYTEDLVGSAFSITNPNAKSSCSCGTSFSV
ncbi:MAG: iron-sulfur cluster insertion protein ErpA [Rhodospirillaceae bacterium]|nr:iron-sulfur cluster insertion protein ErpA [Rhodospirillaceae bacterium]|tara:strand:- start:70 stop:405 length:336 start_codon:yes stop_codon:yes gene_type:complete